MPSRRPRERDDIRDWSLDDLPPPNMLTLRPIRKRGFFGQETNIQGSWQVLAAQTLKIASMNGLGELDKLENELEDEIRYENRSPAKTFIGRLRREGYHKLHSKMVLFIIVFLNVVDCLLVMAELTLDFHHMSQMLSAKNSMLTSFMDLMVTKYSSVLSHLNKAAKEANILFEKIINADVVFDPQSTASDITSECVSFLNTSAMSGGVTLESYVSGVNRDTASGHSVCFQNVLANRTNLTFTETGEASTTLSDVGHKLHYISIAILSVLVVVLMFKILCLGRRFFKGRMQVFDGIVIIISFVLDLVFIEGLTNMAMDEFVMILTFLLPWRILRVLNSLIVAVLDKQRLNLKIIYTQKKKISRTLSEVNTKLEVMQRHVEVLQNLCQSRGIGEYEVKRALGADLGGTKNGSSGGLASMMALGKLAFQAADAFAPMTNGYKKNDNSTSELELTEESNIANSTGDVSVDNNNVHTKLQNGHVHSDEALDTEFSEPYPEILSAPALEHSLEAVTIHLNGSGPPRETSLNHDLTSSSSLPNLADVQCYVIGNEIISRL